MDIHAIRNLALQLFPFERPYPIQIELINAVIDALVQGKSGIFESPTGTGKTISLLCAALAWQIQTSFKDSSTENESFLFNSDEPTWLNQSRVAPVSPQKRKSEQTKFHRIKHAKTDNLDEHVIQLLKAMDSDEERDPNSDTALSKPFNGPKIFFCSRTHSQLAQVMDTLKKILRHSSCSNIELSSFLAISLGSRSNLCINEQVRKLSSVEKMNERCLELQNNDDQFNSCCPYYNSDKKANMSLLEDNIKNLQIADIEDLFIFGKKITTCPYYGSRHVQESANLVTIPYSILFQKKAREAFKIDLKDSIVIVDEAHNIVDAINQIYSVTLTLESINLTLAGLTRYSDKYSKRLSGTNSQMIQQLIHVISQLCNFLNNAKKSVILRINDFLHLNLIDNINAFQLQAFVIEHHLSQKIVGFFDTDFACCGKENLPPTNLLNDLVQFMALLMSSDEDGRVSVVVSNSEFPSQPKLKFITLNPETHFSEIVEDCHSIVFAGGTLRPCQDLLDQLFGFSYNKDSIKLFSCGHLIPKENCQVFTISAGPSNVSFSFTMKTRTDPKLMNELGQTMLNLINVAPDGVVCFFPSFAYMNSVLEFWENQGMLNQVRAKKTVFVEDSSDKSIEHLLESYQTAILKPNSSGALLFAVMGGRFSEGINFSDRMGRLVIVVGLPFPNIMDPELIERMNYYVKRKFAYNSGCADIREVETEFLEGLCMRVVNQTIGRSIRHSNDFAAIVLLDQRYSQSRIMGQLSSWIKDSLNNLSSFGKTFINLGKLLISSVSKISGEGFYMDFMDVILPFPLRWVFLSIFGLALFALSMVFLDKAAGINGPLCIQDGEESDSNVKFHQLIFEMLAYFVIVYIALLVSLPFIPDVASPIFVLLILLIALLQPFNIGSLPLRYCFLRSCKRTLFNSWKSPSFFSDLLLADILTSYSKVLADWDALLWCYLLVPLYHPSGSNASLQCVPSIVSVFLIILPFAIRFRQCIGEGLYSDQKRHFLNAFKYMSSFPVVYLSYILGGQQSGNLVVLWTASLALNFVLSSFWDIFVDWDFGHAQYPSATTKNKPFPWRLRANLLFKDYIWLYYAAAVFNTMSRGIWIYRIYCLLLHNNSALDYLESQSGFILVQSIEIFRRIVWLTFRIEAHVVATTKSSLNGSGYTLVETRSKHSSMI